MKCDRCGAEMAPEDSFEYLAQRLCEDCYIDLRYPPKSCDPWAVYTATRTRETLARTDIADLTPQQQRICRIVGERGHISREELARELGIGDSELAREISLLRHCELVKGRKDGLDVYIVPFK